jgi:hypothetical protein
MLYISTNSKGGVGKSTTSMIVACLLHCQGKKFKIIELDSSNRSFDYQKSEILNNNNCQSFTIDEKEDAISDMLFDIMTENIDYIIDIGGGLDTNVITEALKTIDIAKKWLIPITSIKKYLPNASKTFELINEPKNTYFILNQYHDIAKMADEFLYFFGNDKFGIDPVSKSFAKCKGILAIPFNNYFQISEDDESTILDLANVSKNLKEADARKEFIKASEGQKEIFKKLMQSYWASQAAAKTFSEIEENFKPLFEK